MCCNIKNDITTNSRRESFKLFDEDRGVYVLEDIATNPAHPDHKKLIIAYKKYMMNAAQSKDVVAIYSVIYL
uniref:Uncharacterized protein n=1 Tax=Panagrolaimus sp. ES5 TaxID=591445 RepID=A0AC34FMT7_9BILA